MWVSSTLCSSWLMRGWVCSPGGPLLAPWPSGAWGSRARSPCAAASAAQHAIVVSDDWEATAGDAGSDKGPCVPGQPKQKPGSLGNRLGCPSLEVAAAQPLLPSIEIRMHIVTALLGPTTGAHPGCTLPVGPQVCLPQQAGAAQACAGSSTAPTPQSPDHGCRGRWTSSPFTYSHGAPQRPAHQRSGACDAARQSAGPGRARPRPAR